MGMSSSEQMKWEGQEQYIFWVLQTDKDIPVHWRPGKFILVITDEYEK